MSLARRHFLKLAGAGVFGVAAPRQSWSDTYPSRSVRVIVPFAAAGPTDVVAQQLSNRLGQQFYVENIGGAGSNIGMGEAAKAVADGYTVLFVSPAFAINATLYDKVPYDAEKSFVPITVAVDSPTALSIHPSLPATSVKALVELIKANPHTYSYASPGAGTPPHLVGELFRLSLGLDIVHVPFTGGGPAVVSTLAGHTPILFGAVPPAVPHIKAGKLRGLAMASPRRLKALPDIPTMAEAGYPGIDGDTWFAALAPAGTPKAIVDLLNHEIVSILATPQSQEQLAALGYETIATSPEESDRYIKAEIAKWAKVIREANLKVQAS
jgi:tripartite-type tricarboxylate transporter receptor subunit TctC